MKDYLEFEGEVTAKWAEGCYIVNIGVDLDYDEIVERKVKLIVDVSEKNADQLRAENRRLKRELEELRG